MKSRTRENPTGDAWRNTILFSRGFSKEGKSFSLRDVRLDARSGGHNRNGVSVSRGRSNLAKPGGIASYDAVDDNRELQ